MEPQQEDWRIVMRDMLDAMSGKRSDFEEVEARGERLLEFACKEKEIPAPAKPGMAALIEECRKLKANNESDGFVQAVKLYRSRVLCGLREAHAAVKAM